MTLTENDIEDLRIRADRAAMLRENVTLTPNEIRELLALRDAAEEEIGELRTSLDDKEKDLGSCEDTIAALEAENDRLRAELEDLEAEEQ